MASGCTDGSPIHQVLDLRSIGKKVIKSLRPKRQVTIAPSEINIKQMTEADIDPMVRTFQAWCKERSQYEQYLEEQQRGERTILVAYYRNNVVGYGTIIWKPNYELFRREGIPEIIDLNVITDYQGAGIGRALIVALEHVAVERNKPRMGISVVQTPEYAQANRLYPRIGYVPDGQGIDEENTLHLTKPLS